MSSDTIGISLVVAAAVVESFAQICLKVGAAGGHDVPVPLDRPAPVRWAAISSAKGWIVLGIVAYAVEIFLYTLALYHLDVSVAFPLGSLCFVGVALLSRWLLGETVDRTRWIGIGLIVIGTFLVTR